MERIHFAKARKSAFDRSAPGADEMVADTVPLKPMPPPRGGQKEGARGNHGFPRRVLLVVIFKTRTPCASKVR